LFYNYLQLIIDTVPAHSHQGHYSKYTGNARRIHLYLWFWIYL